jgi:hypothetical protein
MEALGGERPVFEDVLTLNEHRSARILEVPVLKSADSFYAARIRPANILHFFDKGLTIWWRGRASIGVVKTFFLFALLTSFGPAASSAGDFVGTTPVRAGGA